ncbi:MAG: glycosyl hydrolase, partial [Bryobacteraceae bacterium]
MAVLLLAQAGWSADWGASFADPPRAYDMGVYWWWFGPAVTKAEVTRELEVMRDAHISSVLIFPIYPISVDNPSKEIRNLNYLSPQFLDVLGHAAREAHRMGI